MDNRQHRPLIHYILWLCALLLISTPLLAQFGDEEELLPPEQAFAFSARMVDGDTLEASWDIADGYYLYRSRTRFETATPGITLGEPDFPAGKLKQDEFFGEVETYRKRLVIQVPVTRGADAADTFELTAHSQGCADIGVCYPPQRQTAKLDLPAAEAAPLKDLIDLGQDLGLGGDDELLDADQAFAFNSRQDGNELLLQWTIAPGYYLYKERVELKVTDGGTRLGVASFPKGKVKDDEFFGRMEVYHDQLEVRVPLLQAQAGTLQVGYQGCAEIGVCYPPQKKTVALAAADAATAAPVATASAGSAPAAPITEQDQIARSLAEGSVLLTLATFFGFGLLLAFTPCVFPMIPILSSIIVGQGEKITTRRAFVLSVVYVLAMAITYTVAGVIAGMFGENLQAAFQNPWILGSFAAVFVLLSLSMFGFYDLQMPQSLQSKLSEFSNRQEGGTLFGVAIMGFLSALIVGPCVAAPLAGALIYIGQSGDPVLGGLALFALSMGMGAPLIMIGTGAGKLLPRAGGWMNVVKGVFGVMLLAVAIWMLERIIPAVAAMALWSLLLIISAIYMGALDHLGPDATGWHRFWKGSGLAMLVYGILLLVGVAAGGSDITQPLRGIGIAQVSSGTSGGTVHHAEFRKVNSLAELEAALLEAKNAGQPAMLDFYADWCVDCRKLEKYSFSEGAVQQALGNTMLLQADVTDNNADHKALLKHYGLIGPPSILFFDPEGKELSAYRLVGFLGPEDFVDHLEALPY